MQNYSSFTDSELSNSLIQGDRFAFNQIYLRYWRTLHQKACRILKNDAEAEDIIQEVFVSLWQRREEVKVVNLKAYLNQAVKFSVLKAIRENKVSDDFYDKLAKITVDLVCEDPLVFKEMGHLIQHLIDELPEDCRTIFNLSRIDNLTYKKIAFQLGISEKTVEKKMSLSLKSIKAGLSINLCLSILVQHVLN
ncbi:RNA polymerase sigma-70 factor [Pedobacter agri]|uniref:RNA polymerase sigma-70 factor n=1 Tax=Pedobacter agri TaxID=454586 RepID=UPI00292DF191|nr:RNA polymerase sigma-70 factor [Pedobacter agri]